MSKAMESMQTAGAQLVEFAGNMLSDHRFQVAGLAAATLAVAGCGGEGNGDQPVKQASQTELANAKEACGVETDLEADRADKVFGAPNAFLPSLVEINNGKKVLIDTEAAKAKVKEQLASDGRVLALVSEFFVQTRAKQQLPGSGTLSAAQKRMESYETNESLAAQDLEEACNAVDFMVPNQEFAVTRGQTMNVVAAHDKGEIQGFAAQRGNTTGTLPVFEIGFNKDDSELTADQKALYEKLQGLGGFTGDGTFVFNMTFGPDSFDLDNNKDERAVKPTEGKKKVKVTVDKNGKMHLKSDNGRSSGGGKESAGAGPGDSSNPGKVPESEKGPAPSRKDGSDLGQDSDGKSEAAKGNHPSPGTSGGGSGKPKPGTGGGNPAPAPKPRPTATPRPPVATATPRPPVATATPRPPVATATPQPPVATATPQPTATPGTKGPVSGECDNPDFCNQG